MIYTDAFYERQMRESEDSARIVLPILAEFVRPTSAIDVGCGVGGWLRVLQDLGTPHIVGTDGDYLPRHRLRIKVEEFQPADLTRPLVPASRYDLAISLEVAEHLPPDRAAGFISDLTRLSDVVLFSAALPFQGGTNHLNENWLEYWAILFRREGFAAYDLLRPRLWNDASVCWWYRQNLMLFARPAALSCPVPRPEPLSRIHPVSLLTQAARPLPSDDDRRRGLRWYTALVDNWLSGATELPPDEMHYAADDAT